MASREELLQSIRPNMKLDRNFFLKVYGYEISFPSYKDIAIKALNEVGCSKAEEHYNRIVSEYERKQDESIKNATGWYLKKCQDDYERLVKENERTGEGVRKRQSLQNLTKEELTQLCQRLLKEGVITTPEQFAMVVNQDR